MSRAIATNQYERESETRSVSEADAELRTLLFWGLRLKNSVNLQTSSPGLRWEPGLRKNDNFVFPLFHEGPEIALDDSPFDQHLLEGVGIESMSIEIAVESAVFVVGERVLVQQDLSALRVDGRLDLQQQIAFFGVFL